jgi:ribosomal protein L13E
MIGEWPIPTIKRRQSACSNAMGARTTGGKHQVKMVKRGHRPITLPRHKGRDYSRGLTAAILKQAGLRGARVE